MGAPDHRDAAKRETARCAILSVSDTRTPATNGSGRRAAELLSAAGHAVELERIVPNDPALLGGAIREALEKADLVVTLGGTGISKRDLSVETAAPFLARELPGFGELFRSLSAKEIGTATILSRALLGVTGEGRLLCCLPGSEGAARLAFEEILIPELPHLLRELRKTP